MHKKQRAIRVVLSIAATLLIAVAVFLGSIRFMPGLYEGLVEQAVATRTGRGLVLENLQINLTDFSASAGPIKLRRSEAPSSPVFFQAEEAKFRVDPVRWWANAGDWWSAELNHGALNMESLSSGTSSDSAQQSPVNWLQAMQDYLAIIRMPPFERIRATNIKIRSQTASPNHPVVVDRLLLDHNPGEALILEAGGQYRDRPITIIGELSRGPGGSPARLELTAELPDLSAELIGKSLASEAPVIRLDVKAKQLDMFGAFVEADLSPFTPLAFQGALHAVEGTVGRWRINLDGTIDEQSFELSGESTISYQDGNRSTLRLAAIATENLRLRFAPITIQGQGELNLESKYLTAKLNLQTEGRHALENFPHDRASDIKANGEAGEAEFPMKFPYPDWGVDLELTLPGGHVVLARPAADGSTAQDQAEVSSAAQLTISARPFAPLLATFVNETWWERVTPFEASFALWAIEGGWQLSSLSFEHDQVILRGELDLLLDQDPPRVNGRLSGTTLNLNRFTGAIPTMKSDASGSSDAMATADATYRLPDPNIPWERLNAVAADLHLNLDTLQVNQTTFRKLESRVILENGRLHIKELTARLKSGGLDGDGSIAVNGTNPATAADVRSRLRLENLEPADLGLKSADFIEGGQSSLLLQLESQGGTVPELIGALSGDVAVEVKSATVRSGWVDLLGSDLMLQVLSTVNPLTEDDEELTLECAAAYFDVEEGVARSSRSIILETPGSIVRGSAKVDLVNGDLRLDFKPTAREGLGIGLGELTGMLRIEGTVTNPEIELDGGGTLWAGAYLGAAVASGGMSVVAKGLFDRSRNAGGTDCGTLLETAASSEQTPTGVHATPSP